MASTPLSTMARNFIFTLPMRFCKKKESHFFICDWIYWPAIILHKLSVPNTPQVFTIGLVWRKFEVLEAFTTKFAFFSILATVSLECLCTNGRRLVDVDFCVYMPQSDKAIHIKIFYLINSIFTSQYQTIQSSYNVAKWTWIFYLVLCMTR